MHIYQFSFSVPTNLFTSTIYSIFLYLKRKLHIVHPLFRISSFNCLKFSNSILSLLMAFTASYKNHLWHRYKILIVVCFKQQALIFQSLAFQHNTTCGVPPFSTIYGVPRIKLISYIFLTTTLHRFFQNAIPYVKMSFRPSSLSS